MRCPAQVVLFMTSLMAGCETSPASDPSPETQPKAPASPDAAPATKPAGRASKPAQTTDAWIPDAYRSWTQTHEIKHDLDGDGEVDRALVLTGPARDDLGTDRVLLVAMSRPAGPQLVLSTACIAMCTSCGGMMGDPYVGIAQVGKRSLKVSNYGGSSWRWSANYTLAWREGRMMVVGFDADAFHTGTPDDVKTTSINLLSGKASVNGGPLLRHGIQAMSGDDCPAVDALAAAEL